MSIRKKLEQQLALAFPDEVINQKKKLMNVGRSYSKFSNQSNLSSTHEIQEFEIKASKTAAAKINRRFQRKSTLGENPGNENM